MRSVLWSFGLVAIGLCAGGPSWAGVSVDRSPAPEPRTVLSGTLQDEIVLVRRDMDKRLRALVDAAPRGERDALRDLLRHPDLTAALDQALRGGSSEPLARRLRDRPRALRSLVFRVAMRMPSLVSRIESIRASSRAQLEDLLLPHPLETRDAARALLRSLEPDREAAR